MRRAVLVLLAASIALAPLAQPASAAAQTRLQTQITTQTLEVGQTLRLQLQASGAERADNPRLAVPDGFVVNGPSVGTSQQMSIVNGSVSRSVGLTATWQLTATKVGEFTIGPASVDTPAGRISGERVKLKVVPKGQTPQVPQAQPGRSPFDDSLLPGFRRGGRSLFDDFFGPGGLGNEPEAPAEYQLKSAPDDVAFLRAEVDKQKVVIGEQVTLKVYGYGARGRFNENDPSEPRRPKFYSFPVVERSGREPVYTTMIGDRMFHAAKLRELALFPLTTGQQEIGPMTIKFYGSNYITRLSPEGLERKSSSLLVDVVEPPLGGRPDGYKIGDVGNYRLDVNVQPREVEAGGSVSVTATLRGVGNLPAQLLTPEQHGVEWLRPTMTETMEVLNNGKVGGTRTFNYVVRLAKPGQVSLGQLSLPFYDPDAGRYAVARASLGNANVSPARSGTAKEPTEQKEKLSAQAQVHPKQDTFEAETGQISDRPAYWLLLTGSPLSVLLAQSGYRLAAAVRKRRRGIAASLETQASDALSAAAKAAQLGDAKTTLAQLERAVFLGIEASCGLRARALLKDQLAESLAGAGLTAAQASAVEAVLRDTESIRFGGATAETSELLARARKILKSLPSGAASQGTH